MRLIVFDFDKTLTQKDTFYPFLLFAARGPWYRVALKKLAYLLFRILYRLSLISNFHLKDKGIRLFLKGYDRSQLLQTGEKYFAQIAFYPNILALLEDFLRQNDTQVVISTSSLEEYIMPALKKYPAIQLHASKIKYRDGKVAGLEENNYRERKLIPYKSYRIRALFTDSLSDSALAQNADTINLVTKSGTVIPCAGIKEFKQHLSK